eukprot:scaffold2501_cov423-Prasinococcus_capsulatus_cf.AAC.12
MPDRKAVIKNADMSEDMQQDAIDCAATVGPPFPPVDLISWRPRVVDNALRSKTNLPERWLERFRPRETKPRSSTLAQAQAEWADFCYLVCPQALEKYNVEKDIASYIKKEFDKKHNPTWHCIVGRNFGATGRADNTCVVAHRVDPKVSSQVAGSYVTHETKHFVYFYLGQVAILLFKSG